MNNKADIQNNHLEIIQDILKQNLRSNVKAWVFGSRATYKTHHGSDLDLALESEKEIDLQTIIRLKDAFEESDLPYEVDVLDMATIDNSFKKLIEKSAIQLTFL